MGSQLRGLTISPPDQNETQTFSEEFFDCLIENCPKVSILSFSVVVGVPEETWLRLKQLKRLNQAKIKSPTCSQQILETLCPCGEFDEFLY